MRMLFTFALVLGFSSLRAQEAHIDHITVYVVDLQKACAFYHNIMQLDSISEPFKDGKHTWYRIGPHQQLHVVSGATADIPHEVEVHTAFSVPDLAAFCKRLDEANIVYGGYGKSDRKPTLRPDGVLQIYLQDPDGYWIEVNNSRF